MNRNNQRRTNERRDPNEVLVTLFQHCYSTILVISLLRQMNRITEMAFQQNRNFNETTARNMQTTETPRAQQRETPRTTKTNTALI